ncbi:MAG: hypothetical protein V9G14_04490 [Cypionkella sp.]
MAYQAVAAVDFAKGQSARYKDGQCWTLVEDAVTLNGGKSSKGLTPNFSKVSSYVWGRPITIAALQVGDVLQFSNYSWIRTVTVDVTRPDGSGTTDSKDTGAVRGKPQHSVIVAEVVSPGVVKAVEQNIPDGQGWVQVIELVLLAPAESREELRQSTSKGDIVTVTTTTDVVKNPPKCYRPMDA